MQRIFLISISLFLLLSLGSCKTHNLLFDNRADNSTEALESIFLNNPNYQYHIRKDDKITISVWGQDDWGVGSTYGIYNSNEVYGKWLMVDDRGNIEIPKTGTLHVEKKTIVELKDTLVEIFSEWIRQPIVDVKVLNREISVLGEVRDPQVVTVDKERNTLLEIIAQTGGFEFYADMRHVKVFRQVGEHVHVANIDLTQPGNYLKRNIDLHPGDVVVVPSKSYKVFDRRISTIIPFATTLTAAAIFMGAF